MENASQALFMAAGVLIAVLIISLGVYIFSSASTISETYDTTMESTEIEKFNSQFSKYDYDHNTIFDVVSAMNLAYSINKKNNYDEQSGVSVFLNLDDGYIITPKITESININENIENKNNICFIGNKETIELSTDLNNISDEDIKNLNDLLLKYNESKLNEENERVYTYEFIGEISYHEETGLINYIEFSKKNK